MKNCSLKDIELFRQIPNQIRSFCEDKNIFEETVGQSIAKVFKLVSGIDIYYLKVEKRSKNTIREQEAFVFLSGKGLSPSLLVSEFDGQFDWYITENAKGENALLPKYCKNGVELAKILANGLKKLHSIPINDCKLDSSFDFFLSIAKFNVENDLVSDEDWRFSNQFKNKKECLDYLIRNKPDPVKNNYRNTFIHGDFCVPNYFIENNEIISMIDLGLSGIGCEWMDISISLRSLIRNIPKKDEDEAYNIFFQTLGIEPNDFMIDYCRILTDFL